MNKGVPHVLRQLRHVLAFAAFVLLAGVATAQAESPAQYCERAGTDDALRPIPASLVHDAQRLFEMPTTSDKEALEFVQRSTLFRCMDGHLLICSLGANLPCDRADTSRELPEATAFCRDNPGSDFIPMAVTGHGTIYTWRCVGSKAEAGEPVQAVDGRGFIKEYWKQVK